MQAIRDPLKRIAPAKVNHRGLHSWRGAVPCFEALTILARAAILKAGLTPIP